MPILRLLEKASIKGTLEVVLPDGQSHTFGHGDPEVRWRLHDTGVLRRIATDPELQLGETYMAGRWSLERGRLIDLLDILINSFQNRDSRLKPFFASLLRVREQWNSVTQSYRNVAHHYDLDEWLYRRFLDRDMQYSCAYFREPDMDLDAAQQAKCEHIRRKLLLSPGQTVLDIGCGWGGLALNLARHAGVQVTGLTLSREQLQVARQRARDEGLEDRVRFLLEDYRQHHGEYDRIVSVGMFEHVGQPNYRRFFSVVESLLKQDGVALLHTIGRNSPPGRTNPWIRKYIFPGGYIPALSEVSQAIERTGLLNADIEVLRLHYAYTLAAWQTRFQAAREDVRARKGEEFCRMWEFYLAASEAAFRWRNLVVFQLQLARRQEAVPLTRDYLYRAGASAPADTRTALPR